MVSPIRGSEGPKATPTLFVMVGLPASGKTTRATAIEQACQALRLTPDEWMIPLFGEPEADGRRDVLEGRFISVALRALSLGVNVVLDFGVWTRNERSALLIRDRSMSGWICQLECLGIGTLADVASLTRRRTAPGHLAASDPHEIDRTVDLQKAPSRKPVISSRGRTTTSGPRASFPTRDPSRLEDKAGFSPALSGPK